MTLLSNSIFTAPNNTIRFISDDLVVTQGANSLAKLDLCSIKIPYKQFQKVSVQVPAGAIDYVLAFPMMGINITFLTIKPTFCGLNTDLNYIKWKFQSSSDAKWSMTTVMTLTSTTNNPIPPILIDNPNPDCPLQLDVLVSGMDNDYLNDNAAFIYLNNLIFGSVQTFEQTNSGILAFYNENDILVGTVNISDIINITRVINKNRIIIDESSSNNVVLDFVSEYDTLQTLSSLNWILQDPANRSLPVSPDTNGPVITTSNLVISNSINIDLNLFSQNYTKQNFLNDAITSVIDIVDGTIILTADNVIFMQGSTSILNIVNPGNYSATLNVSDIAGNITTLVINIIAQNIIVDITPPIITFTSNVISNVVNTQNILAFTGNQFTYNDAKNVCILAVTDNIDGNIPLSDVGVTFFDINMVPVASPIINEGNYFIEFSVIDTHGNTNDQLVFIHLNNASIDNAPEIDFSSSVNAISMTANISLSTNHGSGLGIFTYNDAITLFIDQITDDVDGNIIPNSTNVLFFNNLPSVITNITIPGTYTVRFTFTDTNLNTIIKNITLTVTI